MPETPEAPASASGSDAAAAPVAASLVTTQVRDTPWWLPTSRPIALWGRIYIPRRLRERLEREDPEAYRDIVEHEMIHTARQRARGLFAWHALYALSKRFRWNEEKAAYHASLRRRLRRGAPLSTAERDRLAGVLAGGAYLFMTDAASARAFLDAVTAEG